MSFDAKRLSHSYITDDTNAENLATAVVCGTHDNNRPCMSCVHCGKASRRIHPDIIEISRLDSKLIISVDQIRALKQDIYVVPNDATHKVYVIKDADTMNANAQNALLQMLEEPPAHAVFILCTDNPAALLPTVRSRCVLLKSQSSSDNADDFDEQEALGEIVGDFIEALAGNNVKINSVKLMECMFRIDKLDRFAFQIFIAKARREIIKSLRETAGSGQSDLSKIYINAESIFTKAEEMLDLNVSPGHISGFICASIL